MKNAFLSLGLRKAVMSFAVFLSIFIMYLRSYGWVGEEFVSGYMIGLLVLCLIILIQVKQPRQTLKKILLFFLVSACVLLGSGDANLVITIAIATLLLNNKREDFIRVFFFSSLILYLITVLLFAMNILPQTPFVDLTVDVKTTVYSLGFKNPNSAFLYFMPIMFGGYYLYNKRPIIRTIITLIGATIIFILTGSRTGILVVLLFLILALIVTPKMMQTLKHIALSMYPATIILSIVLAILFYANSDINSLFTYRPSRWHDAITECGIATLSGGCSASLIDNFPLYLMIFVGLPGFLVYTYILIRGALLERDYRILLIYCVVVIYGMTERFTISYYANFTLVLLVYNIFTYAKAVINKRSDGKIGRIES